MSKQYDFKQAVRIGRHTFPLGIRAVPEEFEKHPHFQKFLKAGSVRVAGAAQVDKKLSDLPTLPPPSSDAAKRSSVSAAAIERGQSEVAPESEIGGDADPEAELGGDADEAADDADDGDHKKGKGKKGKGR